MESIVIGVSLAFGIAFQSWPTLAAQLAVPAVGWPAAVGIEAEPSAFFKLVSLSLSAKVSDQPVGLLLVILT